jgi:3',5'-cyclic AMP phosphodiesterase CpdA
MTRLVHVSDLHFGRHDPAVADALLRDLERTRPDVVAISGDLTQRARTGQFLAARAWIDRLPCPALVVPGNHDLSTTDLFRRFVRPLARYRTYVQEDLSPVHRAGDMVMVGLTTVRRTRWIEGRVGAEQFRWIENVLCPLGDDVFKIVVSHHPLVPTNLVGLRPAVGRAARMADTLDACGVDLLLAGHLHVHHVDDVREHFATVRRSILVVQSGTSLSVRRRGEANSYNVIDLHPPEMVIEVRGFDGDGFARHRRSRYAKVEDRWRPVAA